MWPTSRGAQEGVQSTEAEVLKEMGTLRRSPEKQKVLRKAGSPLEGAHSSVVGIVKMQR